MKKIEQKVKSVTGIKNAILKHKAVWLTIDDKTWVHARVMSGGRLWANYGLNAETTSFGVGIRNIHDFLSFKHSIDLL